MITVAKGNGFENSAQGELQVEVSRLETHSAFHLALKWAALTMDTLLKFHSLSVLSPSAAQSDISVC